MPHQLWHCNCQLGTELYSVPPDRFNECLHTMSSLQGASGLPLYCAKMFSLHVYVQHLPRFPEAQQQSQRYLQDVRFLLTYF